MNSKINETLNGIIDAQTFLNLLGSSLVLDIFYMLLIPLGLISFALNFISYKILQKKEFKARPFYIYMRIYALNNIAESVLIMTSFSYLTKEIFQFSNSYAAIFYGCYIHVIFTSTLYLNSNLLEICILIGRILFFLPVSYIKYRFAKIKKLCLILLSISFLISLPFFFLMYPAYIDVRTGQSFQTKRMYFANFTPFAKSIGGQLQIYIIYIVRDVMTLIIKILLNSYSVFLVKNYLKNLKIEKLEFALKISLMTIDTNKRTDSVKNHESCIYISKTDRNQTYIAIIMCIFSLIEHLFYTLSYMMYFLKHISLANSFYYLALVSICLKYITNFFLLYKFNYLFRSQLKKILNSKF